jgi:hypothetical protein
MFIVGPVSATSTNQTLDPTPPATPGGGQGRPPDRRPYASGPSHQGFATPLRALDRTPHTHKTGTYRQHAEPSSDGPNTEPKPLRVTLHIQVKDLSENRPDSELYT